MNLLGVELETARLRLRPVATRDRDAIFAAFTDLVTIYMEPPTPTEPAESAHFIETTRKRMQRGEELVCTVLDRESGRFLGCAGVHEIDAPAPELGIWIAVEEQGAGRGREAVRALIEWGTRARPRVAFFRYPVDRANAPSRRLAESLGGTVAHAYLPRTKGGGELDIVEYHIPTPDVTPDVTADTDREDR